MTETAIDPKEILDQLTVVIVNYFSGAVIGECLKPLLGAKEIIVVDNGSTDGSPEMIERDFPSVNLIRAGSNLGNGGGLNVGIRMAKTSFTLLIDPDAVLQPEDLVKLYKAHLDYDHVGFSAPVLYTPRLGRDLWVMGPDELQHVRNVFDPEGPFSSWFLAGTVMLYRTEVIQELEGFDDNIFLYCEDVDLCVRIRKAGYSMILLPDARADHLNSQSAKPSVKLHWRKDWNFAWSYLYLLNKHRGRDAMKAEAWKILKQAAPKALFYALVFNRKRFIRDFARTHGCVSYLMGRPAPRPA
ncbi:MAG: glycosyltransferase [Rhodospirillales bacterium]